MLQLSSHCHGVFSLINVQYTTPFSAMIPFGDSEYILCIPYNKTH
jgi:hypothetical protein